MSDLIEKTKQYVTAFNNKDLDSAASLMDENFTLSDPGVKGLSPRKDVVDFIKTIFDASGDEFRFEAKNVWQSDDHTFIEFQLDIGNDQLEGVDIIRWNDGKMVEMRAYLNARS